MLKSRNMPRTNQVLRNLNNTAVLQKNLERPTRRVDLTKKKIEQHQKLHSIKFNTKMKNVR